jgi:hypothetical protein
MPIEPIHGERSPHPLQIDEALEQVLRSAPFHGSRQCQTLLKYLVEHSVGGGDHALKERTIGIEVFGRPPDYNTAEDPVVRARVGELRKRLAQFYQGPEAHRCAVQIVIPSGSYRPTFVLHGGVKNGSQDVAVLDGAAMDRHEAAGLHVVEDLAVPETAAPVAIAPGKVRWRAWGLAAAAACAVLLVAWMGIQRWTKSELDVFWGPILDGKKPVVIYTGTAPVYTRSMDEFYSEMAHMQPGEEKQPAPRWTIPPLAEDQVLTAKDVLVEPNDYVEMGDVAAVVNVTSLLNGRQRSFDLRMGPDLAFEDLHGAPTILVGSYANFWTLNLNLDQHFYFDRALNIRERGGEGRVWSISHGPERARASSITEDYAIICRLFDSKTGGPVITLAGTTTCGTRAAGQFVTDPARLKKLESIIPRSAWERKNLELVLHTTLIDCNPTSVDIVANHSW